MLRKFSDLQGVAIRATDGDIGYVEDLFFDDQTWTVRYLVADTGHWLPGREVLLAPAAVARLDMGRECLEVNLTKTQVEQSPGIEAHHPLSRELEMEVTRYYGWPIYWPRGAEEAHAAETMVADRPEDVSLRSAGDVRGYYIRALDGSIGHVEDYLLDEETWQVRYLIIDTRNWWPGKRVLIAPAWIKGIDWSSSTVRVDLHREEIKNSPAYDPTKPVDKQYETDLQNHYGWPT